MRCSAKLVSGQVDQSAGMLSDDVKDKGYVLLCCALPEGDGVKVQVIEEEELLSEVFSS
jgi:ferredoxin